MIPKSGNRFSEKIMLKQNRRAVTIADYWVEGCCTVAGAVCAGATGAAAAEPPDEAVAAPPRN